MRLLRVVRVSEHIHAQDGEHLPLLLEGDVHRLKCAVQLPAIVREVPRDLSGALLCSELRTELVSNTLLSPNNCPSLALLFRAHGARRAVVPVLHGPGISGLAVLVLDVGVCAGGEQASIDVTLNTLLAALPDALAALERLMACGNPVVEVKAARSVLSFNQKIEEYRLAARLEALEHNK